ncbi:hypothetical protein C7H19_22255 [Aphanothece hegewaldii CCALA 016]|uniref:Uncharacterized protein n=1 Tax=Aphanothece hegewaldii CCALA 016 TaxID=2107694 RepID=A0A2T1LS11_9CHRO|nr:hypothetical protein [Aphanothece hegewaldii]PSF31750.1 hypothetical protein C7H19_22255 [Aphanothece hegewaldii CCALA 016]
MLTRLANLTEVERGKVLAIRQQILQFDSRLEEIVRTNSFLYGKGKSKPCAEIYFNTHQFCYIFLWLPLPNRHTNSFARMRVGTDDYVTVRSLAHIPQGKHHASSSYNWELYKRQLNVFDKKKDYQALCKVGNAVIGLVDFALSKWLEKI